MADVHLPRKRAGASSWLTSPGRIPVLATESRIVGEGEIQLDVLQGQWYFTDRSVGRYTPVVRFVSFCDSTGVILERVPWPFCLGFPKLPAVRYEGWNASMGSDIDLRTAEVIQLTA